MIKKNEPIKSSVPSFHCSPSPAAIPGFFWTHSKVVGEEPRVEACPAACPLRGLASAHLGVSTSAWRQGGSHVERAWWVEHITCGGLRNRSKGSPGEPPAPQALTIHSAGMCSVP